MLELFQDKYIYTPITTQVAKTNENGTLAENTASYAKRLIHEATLFPIITLKRLTITSYITFIKTTHPRLSGLHFDATICIGRIPGMG